jgi:hypothetical protein
VPRPEFEPPALAAPVDNDIDEPDDDEPAEETDEEDEDPLAPDPFVSRTMPANDMTSAEALALRRAEWLAIATSGEHKIYLTDPAGPGTLAEALDQLRREGQVIVEFRDDGAEPPHLRFRPRA